MTTVVDRPAPSRPQHRRRRWPAWAASAAGAWSFAYGVLGLFWALGGRGFPFGEGDPSAALTLFPGATAQVGGVTIAALGVAGSGLALALSRGWGRGGARTALLAAAWAVAAALLVAVPDYRVLVAIGYAPAFVVGAPFDWPPVSYAEAIPWPVLNQVVVMAGGVLWAATALAYQRRTGAGHAGQARWTTPAAAARWGRWAVAAAMAVPLLYAITRYAWILGLALGMDPAMLREGQQDGAWVAGAALATFAVVGAVLTLGLAQRWGEVVPRWIPGLRGRRVPPALAIVPASTVAVCVTSAGQTFLRSASMLALGTDAGLGGYVMLLFPLWGIALGAATLAYHLRRRQVLSPGRAARVDAPVRPTTGWLR